jgi:hypothetical protein
MINEIMQVFTDDIIKASESVDKEMLSLKLKDIALLLMRMMPY